MTDSEFLDEIKRHNSANFACEILHFGEEEQLYIFHSRLAKWMDVARLIDSVGSSERGCDVIK
jgi:hypothetical protein